MLAPRGPAQPRVEIVNGVTVNYNVNTDSLGTLLGRINAGEGPTPVLIRDGRMFDVSACAPTVSAFVDTANEAASGRDLGDLESFSFKPDWEGGSGMRLLPPIDLHCIKAAGVTFAVSAIERVIEERARGDAASHP